MDTSSPSQPTARQPGFSLKAILGFAAYMLLTPAVLFVAGGDWKWWAAWAYFALGLLGVIVSRLIALKVSPAMLHERSHALEAKDAPAWDRVLVYVVAMVGPMVVLLVAGLDHRHHWPPQAAAWVQMAGFVLLILAYAFSTWAMVSNPFFSAVVRIQSERGHHVVSSGPYAIVRHPAYAGGLVAILAGPLLLDALWALLPAACVALAMVIRTALEDRTLQAALPGYKDYAASVKYRLIPGLW
jgi:protein-S-isoprenylcysteine O-methyltransferase Ste14